MEKMMMKRKKKMVRMIMKKLANLRKKMKRNIQL